MILAADVGGTKTLLALYPSDQPGIGKPLHEMRYENAGYPNLEKVLSDFWGQCDTKPSVASLAVAGPVMGRQAQITNLPWLIDADRITQSLGLKAAFLLNDLEAIGNAIPHLKETDRICLNIGKPVKHGNIAVIASGTGLGISFLVWTGQYYQAFATEGGHSAFSPTNEEQIALLQFLQQRHGHVSFERICSGAFLPNLYDFLLSQGLPPPEGPLASALTKVADRTPLIIQAALNQEAEICEHCLTLFIQCLGTVCGNMGVTYLATGGLYLAGGIPPRILSRLQQPDFQQALIHKGRFSALCAEMPVHVVTAPQVGLEGAAWYALARIQAEPE